MCLLGVKGGGGGSGHDSFYLTFLLLINLRNTGRSRVYFSLKKIYVCGFMTQATVHLVCVCVCGGGGGIKTHLT